MQIEVRNFMGLRRASLTLETLLLIGARNFAGKSALCRAVAAALCGRVIPVEEVRKGEAGMLVTSGETEGSVVLRNDKGEARVTWPAAERGTTGKPPESSAFAAGLASILDMEPKERARAIAPYLQSDPTRVDLNALLADAGVPAEVVERIWKKVQSDGWDATHKVAKEHGARLKGEWQQIAKTDFGDTKAETWRPEGWTDDLERADIEDLGVAASDAHRAHDAARLNAAVDADRLAHLEAEVSFLAGLQKQVDEESAEVEAAEAKIAELREQRALMPPVDGDVGMPCPHCGKGVRLNQVKPGVWQIAKAEEGQLTGPEKKARGDAIAVNEGQAANYRATRDAARARLRTAEVDLTRARIAEQELANLREGGGGNDPATIEAARVAAETAQKRFTAVKLAREAQAKLAEIRRYQAIVAALAPEGLRKTCLARGIQGFNERLAALCSSAPWKPVTLDEALAIRMGGRPLALLSASEKMRVRYTLAVAQAQLDRSAVLIFDGADMLDAAGRQGLLNILRLKKMPRAIIAMTFSQPSDAPDLAKWDMGGTVWIDERGVARPLAEVIDKKAA
jgi:hypothetical protein